MNAVAPVLVDTANGWSGRLSGPGILPIVVMVVAMRFAPPLETAVM